VANQQVTVPDIGGAEGAEVIELLVAVGDDIEVDQGLIVLESDKASMEIPSTVAGTVVELLVAEGEELSEGAPIAVIQTASDGSEATGSSDTEQQQEDTAAEAPPAEPEPEDKADEAPGSPEPASSAGQSSKEVPVPDIGTDEAVDVIEISVAVGDTIAEGDSLVVLESDKASMEVPAPFAGEVQELRVKEGDSVRQGDPLLVMLTAEAGTSTESKPETEPQTESKSEAGPAPASKPGTEAKPTPEPAPDTTAPERAEADSGSAYAGPAVRKLAREFGISLAEVTGSGPRGRIVKEDLHRFTQSRLKAPAPAATTGAGIPQVPDIDFTAFGEVEITQRSRLDKLTAANMQRSWLNVPHVTQYDDADITKLEEFRGSLKAEAEKRGTRLTPLPFLLKACACALRENPKFCTSLADGGESLVYKKYVHIGMAVDTPAGLMVPVIRDVDTRSIWDLSEAVLQMAEKARERKLSPADMQGGCFTISSLGNIGGTGFTPIVNAPEVGILGVSRAEIKPVWDGQAFMPRKMLPLSLSYDHRVINGGDAGRFLTRLVQLMGDIRQLIL